MQPEFHDRPIRWGVIGTGGIASTFAGDLPLLEDAEIVAVGSRSQSGADRFGIANRHASYEALVADPEVDVVYVSTPHPFHHANALLAIRAGKHVLVEKPMTLNAAEARELVAAARSADVFLMEAMWTRFLPHIVEIRTLLLSGTLGDIRTVTADHGQWFAPDPAHRIFAPELGGGALLDLGVYPVSFASMVLGAPASITSASDPAFTGVDGQTSVVLRYAAGQHAVLTTTSSAMTANRATIVGTEARIEIDSVFYRPVSFSVIRRDGTTTRHEYERVGHGLRYQAAEVARCLRAGLLESPGMPLDESIQIMETMDEVRSQIGLVYPQERA
jgi:predicted dehydrogenase